MEPIRLLLIDDNPAILNSLTRFLEDDPQVSVVDACGDGREVLGKLEDLRPDVILLDLQLPGMSGLELIPHLRAERSDVGIVMFTLHAHRIYVEAALEVGADDFLDKAGPLSALIPAIRQVVQDRRNELQVIA